MRGQLPDNLAMLDEYRTNIEQINLSISCIFINLIFDTGPYVAEDNLPTGQLPEAPIIPPDFPTPPGLCYEILSIVLVKTLIL